MPGLTKKKTRTKVLRKAGTGRAAKGSDRTLVSEVKDFAKRNESTLKKLGWVLGATNPVTAIPTAGLYALKTLKKGKGRGSNKTVTGQSKGMRGSETKRKRSPHR